ncbi:MAG: 2-phospho-L-lactate transferase [Sphingomonadaceae bacterium]|nr:2-phospho-L-lactate transferase [Sphingomonadaceae bacterium]
MDGKVVLLTGGVGGAKLARGLAAVLRPDQLTTVVNTGDDFTHLGLRISPDIDTLLYSLSGLSDEERGWGRAGESWNFMAALRRIGGEDWFQLGDADLALHVERTHRLAGESLSAVTADFAARLGIAARVLPMSDDPVATMVMTDEGELPFQRYFVARRCEPRLQSVRFAGAEAARPAPGVLAALADPELAAIIVAPSNPYLSIDPILAVPGLAAALRGRAPVIAVTPVPGGRAVKGPTAKIMGELGLSVATATIARHYRHVIDGMVVDRDDDASTLPAQLAAATCDTLMTGAADRARVAAAALALAARLRR